MKLSVGIITFNEERIIAKTIDAVKNIAGEIVIIDSNSTDKTVEIAKSKGAKVITQSWLGYGKQKNFMIDNCSGEWILSIDADEIISQELANEISEEIKKENNISEVYELREKVVCFGKLIKHGGFSGTPDISNLPSRHMYTTNVPSGTFCIRRGLSSSRILVVKYSQLTSSCGSALVVSV